ncbi:hypothetical protein LZ554_006164 [Drepanopeziza brunnea f. sp. 'monogermtubi']|nr:hypothetical protein LZ554_006164 [Drepanopeziza brunnea f. sp. 'monogermtubi']
MTPPHTHTYAAEYPSPPGDGDGDNTIDDGIKAFLADFYRISDTPDAHDPYAAQFAAAATLVMASRRGVGREEILAIRKGMWAAVASRLHTPVRVYPFGKRDGGQELMLFGRVEYVLKDGRGAEVEWAARANIVKEDGKWKMGFYQVYLDTAAMQNAK